MIANPETIFRLPDLGEGLRDAEIVAWHVAAGDHVAADQPLVSVETDKAVVEIPSPQSGRVARLLGGLHDRLEIGAPLVAFATDADTDPGSVVGTLAAPPSPPSGVRADRPRATPAVRALAQGLHVDLATLTGTGPDGEITRADVRHHTAAPDMLPLTGIRRAMSRRMAEAGAAVVAATVTEEADIEAWPPHTPILPRLIAALVAACRAEPALNASFDAAQPARRLNAGVHIGLAVDTEDGLLVPVLRDAQAIGAEALPAALAALRTAALARALPPEALRGATISLSNFGAIGGLHAALVVVPPQVAILGAGRAMTRVVVEGLGVAERRTLPLSLTFDHRAVSGGEAARFLVAVKASLELPSLPLES